MVEYLRLSQPSASTTGFATTEANRAEYEILITTYNLDEENKGESKFITLFHFPVCDCTI